MKPDSIKVGDFVHSENTTICNALQSEIWANVSEEPLLELHDEEACAVQSTNAVFRTKNSVKSQNAA